MVSPARVSPAKRHLNDQGEVFLPKRSRPATKLRDALCLRCLYRLTIATDYDTTCVKPRDKRCEYCAHQHNSCRKIPKRYIERANAVFAQQDVVMTHAPGELEDGSMVTPSPEFIEERKRLMSLAKRLRDDIDGEKRQRWSALGLRGPPRTVEEHLRVLTPIALDIASSLQNIVDVQRVMARLPPIIREEDENSEDEDIVVDT